MALDPKLLDSLPNTLVDMYGVVEIDILSDMARRISTYDYFIPAAQHQMQKLQELGMVQNEIIARLAALTGQTQAEIVDLLTIASTEAVEDDTEYYTNADVYEPSKVNTEALHAQLNAGLLATQQAFKNITRTTANSGGIQFVEALDRAWTQINTGGFDYTTAIRNAITDLAEKGLNATNSRQELVRGAIKYNRSGRVDTLEVAVRRAVVTGANQTAMKTREVLADELEVDLVEVTAHGGARPSHAEWQGKVFSRNGKVTIDGITYEDLKKATGYGTAGGLGGVNCRHSFHPYIPGAPRAYSDAMLKDYEAKNIEYNGEKYTEYEASQIQRKIEREIRAAKRKVAALEAVGEDASAERAALRKAQKSYTDFTEQTGMRKQSARTQVATAKAERAVRKANKTAGVTEKEKSINEKKPITKSADFAVDSRKVQQREYVKKFDSMSDNADERREFLKNAKEILKHRSGQNGEDLYLYNTKTKKWCKSTSGTLAEEPEYTPEINSFIDSADNGDLVAFHNHPNSRPPSDSDVNAAGRNGYGRAYILGHNGKIFEYTAPREPINGNIYELRVAKFKQERYNETGEQLEYNAQLDTMKYLSKVYGFEFREVK